MKPALYTFLSVVLASTPVVAEDFAGRQFSIGANVAVGSLLDCEAPDASMLKRLSPKTFAWAVSQGFVEQSAVTGSASYTAKVTSKNSARQPALIVGCWVATEIVKETVNGQQMVFAKGTFKINDTLRSSPAAGFAVCKKRKIGSPAFAQGDYRILYGDDQDPCRPSNWQDRLSQLSDLERESALFELRVSTDKKGYVRNVAW